MLMSLHYAASHGDISLTFDSESHILLHVESKWVRLPHNEARGGSRRRRRGDAAGQSRRVDESDRGTWRTSLDSRLHSCLLFPSHNSLLDIPPAMLARLSSALSLTIIVSLGLVSDTVYGQEAFNMGTYRPVPEYQAALIKVMNSFLSPNNLQQATAVNSTLLSDNVVTRGMHVILQYFLLGHFYPYVSCQQHHF